MANIFIHVPIQRTTILLSIQEIHCGQSVHDQKMSSEKKPRECLNLSWYINYPRRFSNWNYGNIVEKFSPEGFARKSVGRLRNPNNYVAGVLILVDTVQGIQKFLSNICFLVKSLSMQLNFPFSNSLIPMPKISNKTFLYPGQSKDPRKDKIERFTSSSIILPQVSVSTILNKGYEVLINQDGYMIVSSHHSGNQIEKGGPFILNFELAYCFLSKYNIIELFTSYNIGNFK